MDEGKIELGAGRLAVWPADQEITALDEQRTILRTRFHDSDHYHPGLTAKILELAARPDLAAQRAKSMGGTKLYGLHEWDSPEADLIEARAVAFFKRALGQEEAAVDVSWANIYRRGDYIMPHSHLRAAAAVVYMLATGDEDPEDANSGLFSIVDPRYPPCCMTKMGLMTNPVRLKVPPGTMLIFPGQLVHCVNPYGGDAPRISISWNLNRDPQEGSMLEAMRGQTPVATA